MGAKRLVVARRAGGGGGRLKGEMTRGGNGLQESL